MKKLLVAAIFACLVLSAGNAHAFLTDWQFDADGAGSGAAITVEEYMDLIGNAYIQVDETTQSPVITFAENGFFVSPFADGGTVYSGTNQITAVLQGATGIIDTTTGTFGFADGGILSIYSDTVFNYKSADGYYGASDGTLIGTFVLTAGGGLIDTESYLPNGMISANFTATYLAAGYWWSGTTDLSTLIGTDTVVLGFATTNGSEIINPSTTLQNEIAELLTDTYGASQPGADVAFYISNNGQYRIAAVPEPTSMILLGSGLLGMVLRKKRS